MRVPALNQFRAMTFTGLVCLAAALVFSSCSKTPQQQIIGKWDVAGQSSTLDFHKDGTVTSVDNGKTSSAKYRFLDNTNVELEMSAPYGTNKVMVRLKFGIVIKGDAADMTISLPTSGDAPPKVQTMHLNRAK